MAAPRTVQEARVRLEPDGVVHAVHQPAAARPGPRDDARPARRRRARRRPSTASGSCTATPQIDAVQLRRHRRQPGGHAGQRGDDGRSPSRARARARHGRRSCGRSSPPTSTSSTGAVEARGVPARSMPLAQLGDDGLRAARSRRRRAARPASRSRSPTCPARAPGRSATHACIVEVDVETGRGADRPLRRGRGLRADDQPGDRRRPGPRRGRPGHRRRAVRALGLRRRRPVPGQHVHGLPAADRRRHAPHRGPPPGERPGRRRATSGASARAARSARRPR